jgi:hypothetical protein
MPGSQPVVEAEQKAASETAQVTLYDSDPDHLWNRLHAALFVRAADKAAFGRDELDPLLWPESKYLLTGERHKRVVTLLNEFLDNGGHKLVKDLLKRVMFQHDLWAVFDWLANPTAVYQYRDNNAPPEVRTLQVRLARAIRRLANSAEEIGKLPDNYASAVAAKFFATKHGPEKPATPFLPVDLFDPDGPWVVVGEHNALAAPVHVRVAQGRSAFFVFINLPAGRNATLAYLEELGAFPNPLTPHPADRNAKFQAKNLPRFNPALPQFPVGTQVALAREMLTIDDHGKIRPTRLIESIQFRVYREITKGDTAHPEGFDDLAGKQDFYEFRMTRKDLFAGTSGGLHAVGPKDADILPFVNPGPHDPFEETPPIRPGGFKIMNQCADCHKQPGIHSVEAYRRSFIRSAMPADLRAHERAQQERATMFRKWEDYSWGLLQAMMERE